MFDHGTEIRNQANKNIGKHVQKKNIYAKGSFYVLL